MTQLYSSVYRFFVNDNLPDCTEEPCPFSIQCSDRFVLTDMGRIEPIQQNNLDFLPANAEIVFESCPRKHLDKYLCGYGEVHIDEIIRWEFEKGTHKHELCSNRASQLIRIWTTIKDRPNQLREHIAIKEAENKRKATRG